MLIQLFEIISLETLNNFFNGKLEGEKVVFRNMQCFQCGKLVDIEIQKTSGGYGFLNGILSEPLEGHLLAQCPTCNGKKGTEKK